MSTISVRDQFAITYADKRREYLRLLQKPTLTPGNIAKLEDLMRQMTFLRALGAVKLEVQA